MTQMSLGVYNNVFPTRKVNSGLDYSSLQTHGRKCVTGVHEDCNVRLGMLIDTKHSGKS